jgi:hypothetical protein
MFVSSSFNTNVNLPKKKEGHGCLGAKTIVLQQWHPNFQFDKNEISKLPVWIRLHGLPFPLWFKKGMSLAVSMVGRSLSCDEQTYRCTKLEYPDYV